MIIKSTSLILLLLLIAITTAQFSTYCPYCKVDKCVGVQKNLHSCTECAFGVLITVAIFPYGDKKPGIHGVCQPCPDRCNSCVLDYKNPAFDAPFYLLRCTSCKQRLVWDQSSGVCRDYEANCKACHCVQKQLPRGYISCYQIPCDACDNGYLLADGKCVKAQSLQKEEGSLAQIEDLSNQ